MGITTRMRIVFVFATVLTLFLGLAAITPAPETGATSSPATPQDRAASDMVAAGAPSATGQPFTTPVPAPAPRDLEQRENARSSQDDSPKAVAPPASVSVPAIDVQTELIELGLNPDRTVEVPEEADVAGWYTKGPHPGEVGPAAVIGHVDSYTGPGVFYELADLEVGDEIHVRRTDDSTVTFAVDRIEQHEKDAFPTERVYGDTDGPELRLITCGGVFDAAERSYRDNIVVYASPR